MQDEGAILPGQAGLDLLLLPPGLGPSRDGIHWTSAALLPAHPGRRVAAALLATLAGAVAAQGMSGKYFPLVDPDLDPAPGWKPGTPLPEKLLGNLLLTVRSREAIGTFNAPACQQGEWTLRAELSLKLARKNEQTAEYEAAGGSWKVVGTCRGAFAESFPNEVCMASVDGHDSGATRRGRRRGRGLLPEPVRLSGGESHAASPAARSGLDLGDRAGPGPPVLAGHARSRRTGRHRPAGGATKAAGPLQRREVAPSPEEELP